MYDGSDKVFWLEIHFLIETRKYLKFQDNGWRRIRHGGEEHCKVSLQQGLPTLLRLMKKYSASSCLRHFYYENNCWSRAQNPSPPLQ